MAGLGAGGNGGWLVPIPDQPVPPMPVDPELVKPPPAGPAPVTPSLARPIPRPPPTGRAIELPIRRGKARLGLLAGERPGWLTAAAPVPLAAQPSDGPAAPAGLPLGSADGGTGG